MTNQMTARSSRLPVFLVLAFVCYQFFLCFVNTNIAGVSNNLVAAIEGLLLVATAWRVAPACRFHELAFGLFVFAYFAILWALRGDVELSGLRNVIIIFLSYGLGRAYPDRVAANRLVWIVSCVVLFFAAGEYFFADAYLHLFNVLHYYIARGVVSQDFQQWMQQDLYISGLRPGGRNLFPFLGDQRVASVFLEPVSMGNYAIVLCLWALSFDAKDKRQAIPHFIISMILIVACDSRFASILLSFLLLLRFIPLARTRGFLFVLPFLAVGGLIAFTVLGLGDSGQDNLTGRLMSSGLATLHMSFPQLLGIGSVDSLGDMGIAYSLEYFGLFLCAALWLLFIKPRLASAAAQRFRLMTAVYCLGILLISGTSFYSSKTAVLLWFLYGVLCADAARRKGEMTTAAV